MKYPNEKTIIKNDLIWWNEGANIGRISFIEETSSAEQNGIYIGFDCSGKQVTKDIFISESDFDEEGLEVLTNEEAAFIDILYHRVTTILEPKFKGYSYGVQSFYCPDHNQEKWNIIIYNNDIQPIGKFRCIMNAE